MKRFDCLYLQTKIREGASLSGVTQAYQLCLATKQILPCSTSVQLQITDDTLSFAFQCNCSSFFQSTEGSKAQQRQLITICITVKNVPNTISNVPENHNAINTHHLKLGLKSLHVSILTTTTSFPTSFFNSCNIQGHRGALMANIN